MIISSYLNHEVLVQDVTNAMQSRCNSIAIPIFKVRYRVEVNNVLKDQKNIELVRESLHFKHPTKSLICFRILLHCQGNIHPSGSNLLESFLLMFHKNQERPKKPK